MANAEIRRQTVTQVRKKTIARMTVRHDEMRGQRRFGRRHGPDMQIVQFFYSVLSRQMALNSGFVNVFRYCMQAQLDAMTFARTTLSAAAKECPGNETILAVRVLLACAHRIRWHVARL